jgi:hypothetical protein
MVGGPWHGQRIAYSKPLRCEIRCRLPDPHKPAYVPLIPAKPQCLEQQEIEALTGHTYRREPRILAEDFEREVLRIRSYRLMYLSNGDVIYAFDGLEDKDALDLYHSLLTRR